MKKDKKLHQKPGPKEFVLDWDKIDALAEAGACGAQIAAQLGIHYETLVNHFNKKYKSPEFKTVTEYIRWKKSKGDVGLMVKQYSVAMKGCKTMLVWLGKNRLGQSDRKEINSKVESTSKVDLDLTQLDNEQLKSLIEILSAVTKPESEED